MHACAYVYMSWSKYEAPDGRSVLGAPALRALNHHNIYVYTRMHACHTK